MDNNFDEMQKDFAKLRMSKIEVTYCEWFDDSSDIWNFEPHTHPDVIEMIYFRMGQAKISVSNQMHFISGYDFILYPANMEHKEVLMPFAHNEIICLRIKLKEDALFRQPLQLIDKDQTLFWLFKEIYSEYKTRYPQRSLANDYARLLVLTLAARLNENGATTDSVLTVWNYINDHFCSTITLSALANLVFTQESTLCRKFKKRYGLSIVNYIQMLRVEKCKHMLVATNLSLDDISEQCGVNSAKYMSRMFKCHTGQTPSEFRLKSKTKNTTILDHP